MQTGIIEVFICRRLHMNTSTIPWLICRLCTALHTKCCGAVSVVNVCACVCMCVCMHVYVCMCACMCVCMCVYRVHGMCMCVYHVHCVHAQGSMVGWGGEGDELIGLWDF